ncbi:polyprenyl synthetase family protein [Salinisphaera sp. P385]|uniref:Polyprenyl synthetase family protein n=1 Tax=Spectribacter acetivorans TaxID=3075603 RepID=A0ABU3B7F1_9GAMM|nr:farnesyl diphosphate synthase [Salinisphaera sp. P385]MDT0616921.1 polyprenyl synthetase family protein [Salinisphaera sp. P385]
MSFADAVADYRQRLDQVVDGCLPPARQHPARLHEAMRYAMQGGGKRLRPLLVYATARAVGAPDDRVDAAAAAVEMVHAYSLVHDDLPAMDDDDLRRGKPTCHRAFDEATAILAGDSLLTLAFQLLAQDATADSAVRAARVARLAVASGSRGMAGGQAMDLAATGRSLNLAEVEAMHIHKTGALIRVCVLLACEGAALPPEQFSGLDHYAKCLGLAFQIQDDVLDELGDTSTLGKQSGADRARQKPTYPSVIGLSAARQRAAELISEARASLAGLDERADGLHWLAQRVIEREH